MSQELGGVFYTDGGARPNPGNAGWGVHGYLYDIQTEVKNHGKHNVPTTKGYIETFTGKEGKPVKLINYVDGFGSIQDVTNNVAEIVGFKRTLEYIQEHQLKEAYLLLDSKYVLNIAESWYEKWRENGWKSSSGETPANLELWHETMEQFRKAKETCNITLAKIKGHIGLLGNTRADEMATRGVFTAANKRDHDEFETLPVAGYQSPKVQFNNLFTRNRWYFLAGQNEPDRLGDWYLYYTGYHGKKANKKADENANEEDEDLNPPDSLNFAVSQPDTYYSIVCSKTREPLIDKMQEAHNRLCPTPYDFLVVGYLTNILTAKNYQQLMKYGDMFLSRAKFSRQLELPSGQLITWEINPQRRSYMARETFDHLRLLLQEYLNDKLTKTDLTDIIYETVTEGKKKTKIVHQTRKDLPASARYLDIEANVEVKGEVKALPLRLTLNIDFPVKAHLQRLTEEGTVKPTVTLVTWAESEDAYRYGVVIERNDELLFWVGTDCNLRLIR